MGLFTRSANRTTFLFASVIGVVFISAFFRIVDLDFWWHLKTGQVILEKKVIPDQEIYSFTASGREYIDHEWLFQVIQYSVYSTAGVSGVILFKCALLIATYLILAHFLLRNGASHLVTFLVILLSVIGARTRFIERPELFTAFFLVVVYVLVDGYLRTGRWRRLLAIPLIVFIWSNIHAAVILGILLELSFFVALALEKLLKKSGYPTFYDSGSSRLILLGSLILISLLCTGLNPYGYRILEVPFQLTTIIDSGLLNNQEWQHPPFRHLPFFYLCLGVGFGLTVKNFRKIHLANFLLLAFYGYIALKYVRNVGLFCILLPLFVAPYVSNLPKKFSESRLGTTLASVFFLAVLLMNPFEFGTGIASHFPERLVEFAGQKNLQGNMLNSYAFGGYLIWTMYPERKVFIDGRNEVYLPLLEKLVESRGDSRLWNKLLEDYDIEYALLNYVDELEELTIVNDKEQRSVTYAPFTSTHFPRARWALIYWDDDGMILVKRKGVNAKLLALEYTSVFPEGKHYQEALARARKLDRLRAIAELRRKLREDPLCRRANHLLRSMEFLQ